VEWNTEAGGGGTAYVDEEIYDFDANVTLYAQWAALPDHTVTFDANGGSGSMSSQSANIPTALNANTFTRTGYEFVEWNTEAGGGGTAYADEATYDFSEDITLYAQWTDLPLFTVTFDANGGSGSMSSQSANIPTALNANTFTRTGYEFVEWNTEAGGGGTAYVDEEIYDFDANVTLYAQWAALPDHTVTFNANGGSGSMSPQSANIPTALNANAFTRTGYDFVEWNTDAGGSGTAYADEAFYDFDADVTLYAQWVEVIPESVVASAIPSDETPEVGDSITVTINIDMSDMDAPNDLLGSFTSSLSWNPVVLAYDSDSGLLEGFTGAINPGSGNIQFNGANPTGVGESFDIFIVTFNVIGSGDAGLDLGFSAMAADTGNSIMDHLTINQGSVVAEGGISGVVELISSSSGTANDTNSISFAHTTGTGANRLMLVGVSWNSGDAAENITSVVFNYGSTNLALDEVITEGVTVSGTVSGPRFAAIYSLLNPPSGQAGTIIISFDDTVSNGVVAGAATFKGVNSATPLGTPAGAHDLYSGEVHSAPSVTLTELAGNELVFDTVFLGGSDDSYTLSVDADQTQLWNDFNTNTRGTASTEQATSSSVTMSWTPSENNWWAQVAVPINPASVGPTYDLTMAVLPVSAGSTIPEVGVHTYAENSVVDINAIPATGYDFDSWSGDVANPNSADTTVTMDENKTVTANFVAEEYSLTINVVGTGSVSKDPNKATYAYGESVELTAVAGSGWVFSGWGGALSGVVNPETIEITEDTTITANFVEDVPGTIVYLGDVGSGTIKQVGDTLTITTDAAVAGGDTIIITYATGPHPDLELTVSDSVGNIYEQIELARSYEYGRTYIFAAFDVIALPAGSVITITSDIGSGSEFDYPESKVAIVSVFRGLADIEVVDQALGNPTFESETVISGTDPYVGPTGSTTQEHELVVAAVGTNGPVEDVAGTWQYDFISGQRLGTTGGEADTNWTLSMGYKIVNSTGTFTAQKTGVTDRYYAAVIATFKAMSESNDPPVVEGIPDQAIGEGGSFATINLDDFVEDPDDPDSELTWSYSGNVELSVSIDENRVATITTPHENWFGTETITFTAEDPDGASDSDSAVFEVMSINDPPVVSDIPDQTIDEGESFATINLDDYVEDPDDPDSELTWSFTGNTDLIVDIDINHVATISTLDGNWNGAETIAFTATDPDLESDSDEVTFMVNAVNDPPVLDPIGNQTTFQDEELTFTAIASDVDNPAEDLTFSLKDGAEGEVPEGASIDPVSGVFSWTPTEEQGGSDYTFDVCVSDGELSDCETITVTVNEVNDAPELGSIGDQTVNELEPLDFTATATDDGLPSGTLEFSLEDGTSGSVPSGATIGTTSGEFSWTPTEAQGPGDYTFDVCVSDSELSDCETITVTVNEVNQAPKLDLIGEQTAVQDEELTFTATASDADMPSQDLTFSFDGAPAGAVIDPDTGVFSWTPTEEQVPNTYTFDVCVSDGELEDCETISVETDEKKVDYIYYMPIFIGD
jgi:uncharacterized repeat protein (TIGR02543 family)